MDKTDRLTSFRNGDLIFDVVDSGPVDGEIVVLLHGFPQTSASWDAVRPLLNERGYRTIAPDQRGYSPGARPTRRRDYRIPKLVGDTVALIDALGVPEVHLVGHDWGAAVAWATAATQPTRVRTLTALSVPHPGAFLASMARSNQLLLSWYMLFFQVPWLPEFLLGRPGLAEWVLRYNGMRADGVRRDALLMRDRPAIRAALNWYRAMPMITPATASTKVTVPTTYLWSDRDSALGRTGAELTARYVSGPYEFRVLSGVSHWIPDQAADAVAQAVDQLAGAHRSTA
jgi:pimeloyl-ACP methyl ester carboxylesterase